MTGASLLTYSVARVLDKYAEKDTLQRDIGQLESTPEYKEWQRLEKGRAGPQKYM